MAQDSSGSTSGLDVVGIVFAFEVVKNFFVPVPNKAHLGKTWVNDKRHTWKQWKYGHSSLAVDGKESTNLPNCAIMDNHYVDKPVFMVDLGRGTQVSGVVVLTWQGAGQGEPIFKRKH